VLKPAVRNPTANRPGPLVNQDRQMAPKRRLNRLAMSRRSEHTPGFG